MTATLPSHPDKSGNRFAHRPLRVLHQLVAALTLIVIITTTRVIWPIESLQFSINRQTHIISRVAPGSAAARAGVQVGDRVLHLYNHSLEELYRSIHVIAWLPPDNQAVPLVVDRNGQRVVLHIARQPPSVADHVYLAAIAVLALSCWLSGYMLGIARLQHAPNPWLVSLFWMGLGGVLSCVPFAQAFATPLFVVLLWVLVAGFTPGFVYIHVQFPPRPVAQLTRQRARYWLMSLVIVLNTSLLGRAYLARGSLVELLQTLVTVLPFAIISGLAVASWLLVTAYSQTEIAHTRRQIRLIAAACLSVALTWALLRGLPRLTGYEAVGRTVWLILASCLVPFAYLVGGISSDLYRFDRIANRLLVHLATLTLLVLLLNLITIQLAVHGPGVTLWSSVVLVVCYRPLQHGLQRLAAWVEPDNQQHALDLTLTDLTTSLDRTTLAANFVGGLRRAFHQPAVALFLTEPAAAGMLYLHRAERVPGLPAVLPAGVLTQALHHAPAIVEAQTLQAQLARRPLTADEQHCVLHPAIVLWCPIRHSTGSLLGLLLLGRRGDLDMYRSHDHRGLQRVLAAAALAFANSATYRQQQEAEVTIRQLYHRLQALQDETARAIARELHDDIINVYLRLNIQSLEEVTPVVTQPELRDKLTLVLAGEHGAIRALRLICEQLYPTGLDDPFGLPAVLRMQLQQVQAGWSGTCDLHTSGVPLPLAARTQHEVLRITKEAVTNTIKHAAATTCTIKLRYGTPQADMVCVDVIDDGRTQQRAQLRPGHWGLRGMYESARTIDGELTIQPRAGGGTWVTLQFPALTRHAIPTMQEGTHDQAA